MLPDFTILVWKPAAQRPEEGRYVLIKCRGEEGNTVCDY